MTAPEEHDLPAEIRRDHRAGDKLPSSLAARHQVSRDYVMNALALIAPRPAPATDIEYRACSERLDAALAEDAAKSPDRHRDAFDLYQELIQGRNEGVSYQWVWEHVTTRRPEHHPRPDTPDSAAEPAEDRSWASSVPSDMPPFVTDLINHAVRHLTELHVRGSMPAVEGVELALASLGAAQALIGQAMNEVALVGRAQGVPWDRMSRWAGIPPTELAEHVTLYQHTTTL
ncbi:hypothetical protein [Streptomyces sp. NPDC046161]|uniref:hypothetical protein n=1 Tax=Streptomyces sp. NPDC046161 TaxID=3155132 RepID=UPI00340E0C35